MSGELQPSETRTDVASNAVSAYTARLDKTLKELQDRVKEQEAALKKVSLLLAIGIYISV